MAKLKVDVKTTKQKPQAVTAPAWKNNLSNLLNSISIKPPTSPTPPTPPAPQVDPYAKAKEDAANFYTNQYNQYEAKAKADAETTKATTNAQYDELLRQAYVSNLQNQKKMQQSLTDQGIRGGGSETANIGLMTGYQNTRNKTNSERQTAVQGIDKTLNDNLFNFKLQNDQSMQSVLQQLDSEQRQISETKRQESVEQNRINADYAYQDKVRKEEAAARANEQQAQNKVQYYEARYSKYNNVKNLEAARKKAKTLAEKTAINNRIAAVKEKNEQNKLLNLQAKYGTKNSIKDLKKALSKTKDAVEKRVIRQRIAYLNEKKKK